MTDIVCKIESGKPVGKFFSDGLVSYFLVNVGLFQKGMMLQGVFDTVFQRAMFNMAGLGMRYQTDAEKKEYYASCLPFLY